jgi:hypothetical protein
MKLFGEKFLGGKVSLRTSQKVKYCIQIHSPYKVKWFNFNGHHAKSNKNESEVFHESKKNQKKLYQRIQE